MSPNDKFRSTVVGELSDHGKALLKAGWTPTRWEHEEMGVIEVPLSGDVMYRHTLPNGVVDEISRDGQLSVRAPAFTFRDKEGRQVTLGPATGDGPIEEVMTHEQ